MWDKVNKDFDHIFVIFFYCFLSVPVPVPVLVPVPGTSVVKPEPPFLAGDETGVTGGFGCRVLRGVGKIFSGGGGLKLAGSAGGG